MKRNSAMKQNSAVKHRARLFAGIVLAASAAAAQAHSHLVRAVPANGSVVAAAPARVVLDFSEAARLTAAWIERDGGPKQKLESLPIEASARLTVQLPALAPGRYELSWRASSADGHIVPGHIRFTVSPS